MREDELVRIDEEARARGISREELLKRAAVGGIAVAGAGGLAGVARAAGTAAAAKPKRGGTVRAGPAGPRHPGAGVLRRVRAQAITPVAAGRPSRGRPPCRGGTPAAYAYLAG